MRWTQHHHRMQSHPRWMYNVFTILRILKKEISCKPQIAHKRIVIIIIGQAKSKRISATYTYEEDFHMQQTRVMTCHHLSTALVFRGAFAFCRQWRTWTALYGTLRNETKRNEMVLCEVVNTTEANEKFGIDLVISTLDSRLSLWSFVLKESLSECFCGHVTNWLNYTLRNESSGRSPRSTLLRERQGPLKTGTLEAIANTTIQTKARHTVFPAKFGVRDRKSTCWATLSRQNFTWTAGILVFLFLFLFLFWESRLQVDSEFSFASVVFVSFVFAEIRYHTLWFDLWSV